MKITVVGGGRMGLPLACMFGKNGADVTVSDIDPAIAKSIDAGISPYEEPGLTELMRELHATGRLHGTSDTAAATNAADAIVVIVPAHLTPERYIDFSILQAASADVGRGLKRGALVIYETTVSVGGTRRSLIPVLERESGLKAGADFHVAYSPERVKANLVLARLATTPKVVGGFDAASLDKAADLYRRYLGAPVDEVGPIEAAEMTKLLGMLYRDVNIALVNELAAFCEMAGVDYDRVRAAANTDGEANLLIPGIGVGGHCTPVYPYFLTRESRRLGVTQRLAEAAREVNDLQPARQLDRVAAAWKPLGGTERASPWPRLPTRCQGRHVQSGIRPARLPRARRRERDDLGSALHRGRDPPGGVRAGQCRGGATRGPEHRASRVRGARFRGLAQVGRGGRAGRPQSLGPGHGGERRSPVLRDRPLLAQRTSLNHANVRRPVGAVAWRALRYDSPSSRLTKEV